MVRLVLCCDGTWSTLPEQGTGSAVATNVAKLYGCLATHAPEQASYYHPGLGSQGGPLGRVAAGLFGRGLGRSILTAYLWLAENYRADSEIFLFGYSRGAYTVRSLAGMLRYCGLLKFFGESDSERWRRIKIAYRRGYRARAATREDWAAADYEFHHPPQTPVPIRFIGVWETVGSLGIPNNFAFLNLLDSPFGWAFHDTSLGPDVRTARHALALDERRASFTPTIWRDVEERDVEQLWFAGSHADVGGGNVDDSLSNISLHWMIDEARRSGVSFSTDECASLETDPSGKIHDSVKGVFLRLRTRPRSVPKLVTDSRDVHGSVLTRVYQTPHWHAPYRPTRTIEVGASAIVEIFARLHWNETGIYLDRGDYVFSSAGRWADGAANFAPEGDSDEALRHKRLRYIFSDVWGYVERAWRSVTGNSAADFWYTRRLEHLQWMVLVGVIANDNGDANPDNDGSPQPHEHFRIGKGTRHTVDKPGYLYAYANDIWSRYGDNSGSVRLTVTRI